MPEETEATSLPLEVVDGCDFDEELRSILRPGELLRDREGRARRLPRFFYRVESWEQAADLRIAPNFRLSELINVDIREARAHYGFPKYVPCAVALLAAALEVFRSAVGTYVHVAANGGYRTPAHALSRPASPHCWGTAANLFRIGDELLDRQDTIEKYNRIAREALPALWARPWGHGPGEADDHVHLDLGYVTVVPHGFADEKEKEKEKE